MLESENKFKGLGVSSGIGMGVAHVRESGTFTVPVYSIPATKVDAELGRLKKAVTLSRRQISLIRTKAKEGAAEKELGYLLDAYIHMLKDSRLVRGTERRIAEDHLNALSEQALTHYLGTVQLHRLDASCVIWIVLFNK